MRKNQELQLQSEFTSLILVDSITTEKVLEFSPTQRDGIIKLTNTINQFI